MSQQARPAAAIDRWCRTFQNFARRSISNSNQTTPNNPPSPSSTTAAAAETVVTSPPSTASPESQSIHSSNTETTLPKLPHTTAAPQPQSLPKTLDSNVGLVNSVSINIDGNKIEEPGKFIEPEKPDIELSGSEKIIQVETVSVAGSGDGNENTANLPSLLSVLENEGSVKPVIGPEIGADGVAESGNGKMKKKIVKRVVANDSENQGLMEEPEEGEITDILRFGNYEIEKSNSVDELIDKPSFVDEANVIPNIANDIAENLVNDDVIEKSNEIMEKVNITNDMDRKPELVNSAGLSELINCETSQLDSGASEQMVKSNDGIPRVNHVAENVMETDICVAGLDWKKTKEDDIRKVFEKVGVVDSENQGLMVEAEEGEIIEIPSFGNNDIEKSNSVDELIDKPSFVDEANVIPNIADDIAENLNDDVIEKSNVIMEKANITNDVDRKPELVNSAGLSELINGETSQLDSGASLQMGKSNDGIPRVNHVAENVMETDICVSGLEWKKTKEDDIRKVFEKVGVVDSENQGLMVEAEEGEIIEIPSFGNNDIEKSNSVDELVDKPSFVDEANVIPNIVDDIAENLNDDVIEKSNVIMEKANITNDVDRKPELVNSAGLSELINGETSQLDSGASLQMGKSNDGIPRVNHVAENVMETDICVSGLEWKKTKEDDIRKVFEEVGVVVEVRLAMFPNSLKNRGFAFVRFATAADAKNALAKWYNIEICGKQCSVAPVGKISLGNLDENWETEYVVTMLEKVGIEKIVKVTRKKKNTVAILEFGTSEDAQIAFNKIRKKDAFRKNPMVEVEWAKPDEEENFNVKSVYAEYLPSSWDEEKVREYFKRFGEIENVVMATDILSSRRKDSAFIHYTTRDAALRCIEVVSREISEDDSSKVTIVVSLANLNPTSKPMRCTPDQTSKQLPIAKPETRKHTVWSRLGTRGTGQNISTSVISAKLHDRLGPIPFKSPASNSDEASPAKISAKVHGGPAPIPLERSASHSDEASPANISAKPHDRLSPIPLTRPASHSDEASPAKKPKGLSGSTSPASPSDEASPEKIPVKLHDRLAPIPLKRPASPSDEASPVKKSAKLYDQLAPIPLKTPASHSDEASPAKKPKGLSGSTSPPSPTSSPIMTSMLNLADGKIFSRYIQSLCPSPDSPTLDKMGDTELIDSYCLDQSKAMAKLAEIVSRSQRGFTNLELANELNSLKKDNAELRSELEKSQTIVLRLMDVADTFRMRAKSQEGEIKNLENENAALRAEMDDLQADCIKLIDEARTEGIRAGHQGFSELALINRFARSQRGLPLVWRNFEPSL